MQKVKLISEKVFSSEDGKLFHFINNESDEYFGFGEVYVTTVNKDKTKKWRKHTKVTCNIVVPFGRVLFEIVEDELNDNFESYKLELNPTMYKRLVIPPNVWFRFSGIEYVTSVVINLINQKHDDNESIVKIL